MQADAPTLFRAVCEHASALPGVTSGRMFGAEGLKVNGSVFAMLVKDRLVLKLPATECSSLIAGGHAAPFDPGHGRTMKEWVSVSAALAGWGELAESAYRYVRNTK
jgi:TfoX/Sxy family transcriptional regulator of competence genes